MMDGSKGPSHYVRIGKEKDPVEDITPGELSQPVNVPQLIVHRCGECGQPLPESYEPPSDEDWTTGIFGCLEDTQSCKMGMFCPCILFGQNVETVKEDVMWNDACMCHAICVEGGMVVAGATMFFHGIVDLKTSFLICETLLFAWWLCGIYNGLFRQSLQKKYHLKNSPCDPCLVHCCLHWCAMCQEYREMQNRISDNTEVQSTIVKPPPLQEMNTVSAATTNDDGDPKKEAQSTASSSSPSAKDKQITKLEIQPV
ncbi:hypothetical protein ES332_D08G039800v1 [Gossypium tomentosum]|uniref:Cell number regulator 6 n=1 Tax=Gossypium tomentosum TaxID=34277 RepID=A0A5D2JQD1_GOSTO|nr:hypothetical protein ES332_D08G039800v1 [Gossypium tomentosum]